MATAKEKREQREAAKRAEEDAKAVAAGKPTSDQIEQLNKDRTLHPDKTPNAHGQGLHPGSSTSTVLVGFKVGIAYLDLQLSKLEEQDEQTQTGIRRVKVPIRFGPVVRIRGTAYPRGQAPEGFPERPEIIHGATMNRGVDRNFMTAWLELNKLNPIVTNRMIFIAKDEADFRAIAAELAGERSGFEPVDPKKDPRMPKPTNKDVGSLEPADRAKA